MATTIVVIILYTFLSVQLANGKDYLNENDCEYTCEADKSCRVKYPGSDGGACFPPDFGGACVGIPSKCEECKKKVDCSGGATRDASCASGGGACSEGMQFFWAKRQL